MSHDAFHAYWTRSWRVGALAAMTLLMALAAPRRASGQLSPGPLARAHKSLEGTAQCVQCHPLSRAPMAMACLTCHKDVKSLVDQRRGYHARIPAGQRMECASCHPDHAGVDFALIAWPGAGKARFDHRQTGWALEGKHLETKCEDCHTASLKKSPVAALSKRTTGTPWIGLETTCNSCHERNDIHNGELRGGCDQCHSAKEWAPAPKFDHANARFPLTGKHEDAKCDGCHKTTRLPLKTSNTGAKLPLFRPVPFAKCNDCHADPHKGRIREACSSCHETTTWATVDKRGFNHGSTRYPLKGQHARVACADCHGRNNERPTPAFASCAGCHADVHRGEAGPTRECASCHRVEGFAPALFSVADHARTRYPLEGKHAVLRCAACHAAAWTPATSVGSTSAASVPVPAPTASATSAAPRYVRLKFAATDCASCHEEAHGNQPAIVAAKGGCSACHTVSGFAPSTMSVASHAAFRFALDGAHATAACAACHRTDRRGLPAINLAAGRARFAFALGDTACASCHADPHAGRYLARGARAALGCRGCHATARFRPSTLSSDDHRRLGYALEGAHQAVPCVACHRELTAPAGRGSLKLSAASLPALPFAQSRSASCTSCHQELHGTQFVKRKDRGACDACHTVARFAGAEKFNHEKQTRFPLAGAHATVSCAKCHPTVAAAAPDAPASARRQYAGVSIACESCHAAKPPGAL